MQQAQVQKVKTVLFVNFSDQPFSAIEYPWLNPNTKEVEMVADEHCKWDGIAESFKAKESRYMEDWRAAHFARHLINRELDKQGKALNDATLRDKMIKQCIMNPGREVPLQNVAMELMNRQHENSNTFIPEIEQIEQVEKNMENDPEYVEFLRFKASKAVETPRKEESKKKIKKEKEFPDLK